MHVLDASRSWNGRDSKWYLYDEKFTTNTVNFYNPKDVQGWLIKLRNYVAGRTPEIDGFLDWVEVQTEPIDTTMLANSGVCMDKEPVDVSRQLWAMLAALVALDEDASTVFANVQRLNGAEAYRRITEPIIENRDARRQHYQPKVTNPKSAAKLEDVAMAVEHWESDYRKYLESKGTELDDEQRRLILIDILPPDVGVFMTLQLAQHPTYAKLRAFIRNYIRTVTNKKLSGKGMYMVDDDVSGASGASSRGQGSQDGDQEGDGEAYAFLNEMEDGRSSS